MSLGTGEAAPPTGIRIALTPLKMRTIIADLILSFPKSLKRLFGTDEIL